MSKRARVTIGTLPSRVGYAHIQYRELAEKTWHHVGYQDSAARVWKIPATGDAIVRATPVAKKNGTRGTPREQKYAALSVVADKVDPKSLTFPAPDVAVNGATIEIRVKPPKSNTAESYTTEVRISKAGKDEREAIPAGEAKPGETITANQMPGGTKVHTRPYRDSDGRGGDWATTSIGSPSVPPEYQEVEDHAGLDFSTGYTIQTLNGYTPLQDPGASAGLEPAPIPPIWNTTNTDSIWGADDDVSIWGMAGYFPVGEAISDALGPGVVSEFHVVTDPTVGTWTYDAAPIWGWTGEPFVDLNEERSATATVRGGHHDRVKRLRDFCMWNTAQEGDVGPLDLEEEISLSQDGAAYDDYIPCRPGPYRAKNYKLKLRMRSRRGRKQLTLDSWKTLRWHRNRKEEFTIAFTYPVTSGLIEYTFSPDPAFVTTPTATMTVEDAQNPTGPNDHYVAKIESISTTAIEVRVRKVVTTGPTWSTPAVTDLNLHLILTGY